MVRQDEQVDEYCGLSWAQDITESNEALDRSFMQRLVDDLFTL